MEKKKLSIKDMFIDDSKKEIKESVETKPKNRMVELIESFDESNEVIKDKKKSINKEKLNEEKKRLKEVAKLDENQFNYWAGNQPAIGQNQTVNTAFDPKATLPGQSLNSTFEKTNMGLSQNAMHPHNPNYTYLQPSEALRLSISRALNSGAPVNNLTFYDEINREMNTLGFNSKSPLDIKNVILKMIKD